MTVVGQKLSVFTPATSNLASTDSLVGVRTGPADALFSASQITNGLASQGLIRERLSGDRNYYVATTGNDSNSGLSSGTPFLTIQQAFNTVFALDFNSHYVTIIVAPGTYNEDIVVGIGPDACGLVGAPDYGLELTGDTATPSNCMISSTSACLTVFGQTAQVFITGFKLVCPGGSGLFAQDLATIGVGAIEFGNCSGGYHMIGVNGGSVNWFTNANRTISGNAIAYIAGFVTTMGGSAVHTVTLVGTPNFSDSFVVAEGAFLDLENITFTGSATGRRFKADGRAVIGTTFGASLTYLPGSTAGICDDSSIYGAFFRTSSRSLGTVSSGTIPALDTSNTALPQVRQWYYTNNGAHTFPAPTIDGPLDVFVTNGASAGTITFTGFTAAAASTAALTTTNGQQFWIQIMVINSVATLFVRAMQ